MLRSSFQTLVVALCAAAAFGACSGSDEERLPGIDGPAQVDPNSGADNSGTGAGD